MDPTKTNRRTRNSMAAAAAAAQLQTLNPGIIVAPPRLGRQQRGARSPGPLTREEVAMDSKYA